MFFHVFIIEQNHRLHGDWQHGGRHKRTVRDAGQEGSSMIPDNQDNGNRQTKTREMAKDHLARAGRRQNIRPGAFIHSGRKRPNPFTVPPDQFRRFTLPPHAIPEPTGRVETAPRVILLRPSGTPPDAVEGGTNSGGTRSRNYSSGSNLVERSSPFGTSSGTIRVEPAQMKPFQ